ncbi:MAG: ABC transporter ATP-binding protein [Anaerolineaceae bacterium]|nr:ABC transporter ATP-binding protein [Anaerolineaceae bacterium]
MINVQNLTFSYQTGLPVFQQFNWLVEKGESWVLLGPSGCGKSTLLYLLAGLRFPNEGQVLINGNMIKRPRPETGLIIQDYGLMPWATVFQNAALGLTIRDFYGPDGKHAPLGAVDDLSQVEFWLERLGLLDVKHKYPDQLSGGQRQRTAIARTLAIHPDLFLMDEPFSSLDAPTRESLQQLVLELWREQNLTLVTVTHSIEEAAILGQKILLLKQPPNTEAQIIHNSQMNQPLFRQTAAYQEVCQDLRERMLI